MSTAAKPTRENRTITVDFQNETTYFQLLGDGKAFLECVIAFLLSLGFQLKHKGHKLSKVCVPFSFYTPESITGLIGKTAARLKSDWSLCSAR